MAVVVAHCYHFLDCLYCCLATSLLRVTRPPFCCFHQRLLECRCCWRIGDHRAGKRRHHHEGMRKDCCCCYCRSTGYETKLAALDGGPAAALMKTLTTTTMEAAPLNSRSPLTPSYRRCCPPMPLRSTHWLRRCLL